LSRAVLSVWRTPMSRDGPLGRTPRGSTQSLSRAPRQSPRVSGECVTPRRVKSFLVVRVVRRIPPLEFFHPACGIDQLLPASPPRMTRSAGGDAEMRDRRASGIGRTTRAHNRGLTIRGMDSSLHGLLLWRCYGDGAAYCTSCGRTVAMLYRSSFAII